MMLLIPLGTEAAVRRPPLVTIAVIAACTIAFLVTNRPGNAALEREEARIERIAAWTLEKAARDSGELAIARARHGSALALLRHGDAWRDLVADDEARTRLERCLADARAVTEAHPFHRHGFVPADIGPRRLLTHQFLHADPLHLVFNMLFLWVVGSLMEATWGPAIFLPFYLASGVAAALSHAWGNPGSIEPAIGASGAVAGVMGAFLVTHARLRIRIAFVAMVAMAPRIHFLAVPAWLFLGFWIGEQLFLTALTAGMNVGVAFLAHLGGFAFGAAAALPLRLLRTPELEMADE